MATRKQVAMERCSCGSTHIEAHITHEKIDGIEIAVVFSRCTNCGKEEKSVLIDNEERARKTKSGRWVAKDSLTDNIELLGNIAEEITKPLKARYVKKIEQPKGIFEEKVSLDPNSARYKNTKRLGHAISEIMTDESVRWWVMSWFREAQSAVAAWTDRRQKLIDEFGYETAEQKMKDSGDKIDWVGNNWDKYCFDAITFLVIAPTSSDEKFKQWDVYLKAARAKIDSLPEEKRNAIRNLYKVQYVNKEG